MVPQSRSTATPKGWAETPSPTLSTSSQLCTPVLESDAPSATPSPLFLGDGPDDDPLRARDEWDTGDEKVATTARHLREKVEEARQKGTSDVGARELSKLLTEYADIFRTKLGPDPPVDVPPTNID